ncbi:MAG: amino acid adenylation domain-containing protein [Thermoanaerobaculia bacterium]
MPRIKTIPEILEDRGREQGERPAYIFLSHAEAGVAEERVTWAELDARARAIGASLQAAGASGGERVALLLPPGPDFVASFFGCLYAGAVAVPALPPRPRGGDPRLRAICRDARPRVALAAADRLAALENAAAEIPELAAAHRMAPAPLGTAGAADWRRPDVRPESLAFLQYTSGSTSSPKGVMVSHGNLLHNEELIRQAFEQSADSVVLGWLPLHHDMGLIGTVLQPLYTGALCYLMTPGAFLQRPARWLEAISRYRATTSGGPNFAYELCVRKVGEAERESLDLSSWRVAFNGAEPVRAATLRRFAAAFAPSGFRASAFRPCYGLAEATLLVSGWRPGGEPRVLALDAQALEGHDVAEAEDAARSRELVGCGAATQTVLAVDPETGDPCRPGRVGEVWVAGPSVAQGYWERPEETAATFGARLADGAGPFLRTGDLGFVSEGELFLTGRLKDLIILRGRNHYPQDLELTAERGHADLRAGGGAAFAVDLDGEERLVIVHEVERHARAGIEEKAGEIAAAVRRAVAEEHEVSVAEVVLIRPETLPRTSSGKVRRSACRELYLQGGLRVLGASRLSGLSAIADAAEVPSGSPDWLRRAFAAAARVDPYRIDADLPLSASGLDSLAAVELKQAVEEAAGVSLSLAELLEGMTLRELERRVGPHPLAPSPTRTPARPGEGEEPIEHPLSWNQRSLWFLHRLAPESPAYNIAGAARIVPNVRTVPNVETPRGASPGRRGGFDSRGDGSGALSEQTQQETTARSRTAGVLWEGGAASETPHGASLHWGERAGVGEALGRAVQALVDRHPMLRATFADTPGGPVQRVAERGVGGFEVVDATGWSDAEVHARLHAEAYRPFDLAAGPLLRAVLLRRGDEAFLAFAVHHVAADFWSMAVLARELGALVAGEAPPAPAALYTDFARRQEEMLESPAGERLWEHWRQRLDGTPQLDLPTDRPRRPARDPRGGSRTLAPSAERAEAVHRLAAAHGCTPFVALLAAWQAVLSRWSGQEEFLTGAPMAGRSAREWGEVVGYFVNLVPLRADLSGDPGVGGLMARTRGTVLDALAHQDLPFALLTERLQPERDPGRPPLVAAMLTYEKAPAPELAALAAFAVGVPGVRLDLGWLALESLSLAPPAAQLDLALTAAELPGGLAVSLQWDAGLFDATTAGRMLGHLDRLLAEMTAMTAADRPVLELPMLGEAERHQAVAEWNDTAVASAPGLLAHGLFEAQAARTPDAPAVTFQGETLTYAELDARADRLAARLRRLGCGPESRVGISLERSLDLAVSLLGVLKAGAAYVPLDPGYPRERLAFVLEDAAPRVVIDEAWLLDALPPAAGRAAPDPVPGDGRQLAYVLYTSGSTGRPKGVGVPHRALVNFLASMRRAPGFAAGERLLAVTSLSFDIAALEIFLPLTVGGCVELASREEAADGALLAARLRASGASVLQGTPATWRMLLDAGWQGDPGLRALCGGEAMPSELAASLAGRTAELWNLYGPTETTVWSAAERIRPGETGPISIGRPIADTRIHLLDRRLRTVPPGAHGELWIGGAGLSRGYLGRPDLTAERFMPDPFAGEPGERLYRTGDLARHLPGGRLEVLGRLDHQVKVRGFRIELGEIEAVLAAQPGVRAAIVLAREERLVAYLVGDAPAEALRQGLRDQLPDYMVPAAFVTLPALPLTPNGKVDRKALPAPDGQAQAEGYVAPRTPVEEVVAGIWAEVLGLERVGVADHFFALGGHSLLATRVMSRLRAALGVEVPLRDLFAAPRLADFAARVEALRRTGAAPAAPPLLPVPREGALPLSFAQQRLWFVDQLEPGSPLYNMPGALRIEGPLDGAVLARSLREIVRRHEALRTVFEGSDAAPVQVILPAAPFPLPVVDLAGLPEGAREALALALIQEEAGRPFDLTRGPLLRGLLLRLAGEDHAVALTLHHIAGDGWSLGILVREIAALYPAFAAGRPSPLPELPVQYADYAVWQRSWLRGEVLEGEIAYWRGQLAGLPPLLELPTDRPRPAARGYRGAARPLRLPAGLTRQAEALARREGATLFMVLLAAFQALLARTSGQDDLAVGSPVAGRGQVETEGLIGFFVNNLVLRGDLSGAPTFGELLGRVRETALAAWLHQEAPFEKLVEELAPERDLAHAPLFQAMLVLQNAPAGSLEIEGLRLRPVSVDAAAAKLDLTLILEERGGGLAGAVEYATELFDAATIDRLAGRFERLLAAALAAPERRAAELPWLGEAERQQIQVEWNDTVLEPLDGALVHEAISATALRSPGALAVAWDGGELAYGELERRSNRLARRLRRLGVGPEVLVGLCCDRSGDAVVGVLGILKAGGAYVPLDPEYPEERLKQTLADCGAPVLVAQERTAGLAAVTGARLVRVDAIDLEEDDGPLPSVVLPENPAYVIYTSGSTGRPKGVVVTHGALARSTRARSAFYRQPVGAYLLASSLAFDSSVAGLFWTLQDGGTLVLHRDQSRLNLPDFLATLARRRASHLLCLPSLYSLVLEHAEPGQLASLRTVIVAGEACPPALVAQHAARLPGVALVNEYGPTEGTVWSSARDLTAAPPSRVVSIGRAIGNVRLHPLDRELEPVPAGVHGELWIGGASLARGYLGRPDLTAERFLPDPFAGAPGARMYRTGDLMRWLPDGSLDFLGRVDHQVKIRGFRVELGEIEAALLALPGVREAVVVARDQRLAAYVVGEAVAEALRDSLRERLPDYMVPTALVTLPALPLTANGKVDRNALPAPDWRGAREGGYVAPRSREEEILAEAWAQVLRLPRVGVNDNFFELGGDSILSVQIVARARRAGLLFTVKQIFEHQTVAGLARHATAVETAVDLPRAGLDEHARNQLAALLVDPANVEDAYPLSPAQNGILFHGLMAPGSGVYVTQVSCTLPADLDAGLFRRAWERLVERHGVLRTAFFWDGLDEPLQVVRKTVALPWEDLDWRGLAEEERRRRLEGLLHRDRHAPLTLTAAPLMRFALARHDHGLELVWTSHHLLLDGWSLPLLLRELEAVYAALREGREPALPPARPFGDYIAWLRGQDASRAEPFWRQELAGFTAPNSLGLGGPAGGDEAAGYAGHGLQVSRQVTARLRTLAARHKLTLQALTLGAWAVLVSRYGGEDDVVFGCVVSGRPAALPGVEAMVGMFINTLPVRVRMDDAEPLASWLGRLQERQLARQELEHTPLSQIQRWSEVPAGSPLFETLYVFENYPDAGAGEAGGLGISGLRTLESTNYPVTLELTAAADEVSLQLTSDLGRVDRDAAPRLLRHLAALLSGMAEGLERGAGGLDLLSAAERHQAIVEWNDTAEPTPARADDDGALVLDLLAAGAARAPDRPAVVHGEERLTHGELAARADRLAARLRALGVGPDVLVGLFLERSADLVVALLAVLKAGGAYLPLETSLPRPRLSFMLDDARPSLLLTRTGLLPALPEHSRVVCLDELPEVAGDGGDGGPAARPAAGNLAYVLYTSGSTGLPKGVAVTHGGLANYLLWAAEAYPAGEGRGAPVHSPLGFDLTVTSLFLPLLAGRCVELVPEAAGVEGLAAALAEGGFGLVKLTPAHLDVLRRLLPPGRVAASASAFVIGGEALSGEQLAFWRENAPGLRLINEYGPTETVVGCAVHELPPTILPAGPAPIGRPIANTRILLLDRGLRPVPIGVPGELCIGGAGVCRGYLNRPALTAEKLVPDPFGPRGERLYRTGDLARRLPDGTMEFLGRVDRQVKIRGFRVEPGEIEAALAATPGVREAAVVAREGRLVAYVTGGAAVRALQERLRERLPEPMVPAAFVALETMPLTPNGKVDRKALPAPDQPAASAGYVAPRTREEEILAGVWAQVLRLPRVGVNDNFFELGGDSILSVQIVSRARQAGLLFTVRQIFEHQTVAGLALYATATEAAAAAGRGPVTGEVPLTPIQRWFFAQGFADPHHFNQALRLEAREPLVPAALERALAAVVEHHDALRMRFDPATGRQENAAAEPATPFHQVDLSALPTPRQGEAYEWAAADLQAGFDLAAGPLTRLCLFSGGRLLWVTHHLVVDGVSWRLLVEDLEEAYRQAAAGRRPALPPKTTSFQEWSRRLAAHAASGELAGELEHWRETARVPVPRLPVDSAGSSAGLTGLADLVGDEATVSFELTAGETSDLLQALPAVYHSRIDEALLSALARALAGWTGSPRLRVDLEGHGREPFFADAADAEDLDVSRTVGWFTSLYPVVLEAGDADPGAALVSAKERLRAVPGRGIGYGLLGLLLGLETAPAAEVLFNYLGQADAPTGERALFRASTESIGPCRSPRARRTHPLEVTGMVTGGRLRITLTYGSRAYARETAERLAAGYAGALRQLIGQARESEEVFTPSDFAKAGLDAAGFARVAALLADDD